MYKKYKIFLHTRYKIYYTNVNLHKQKLVPTSENSIQSPLNFCQLHIVRFVYKMYNSTLRDPIYFNTDHKLTIRHCLPTVNGSQKVFIMYQILHTKLVHLHLNNIFSKITFLVSFICNAVVLKLKITSTQHKM